MLSAATYWMRARSRESQSSFRGGARCSLPLCTPNTVFQQESPIVTDFITCSPLLNAAINAVVLPAAPSVEQAERYRRYQSIAVFIVPVGQVLAWLSSFGDDHPCRQLRSACQGLMAAGVLVVAVRVLYVLYGVEHDSWHIYRSFAFILGAGQVVNVLTQLAILGAGIIGRRLRPIEPAVAESSRFWLRQHLSASALFSPSVRQRCSLSDAAFARLVRLE